MGLKCRLFGHTYGNPEVERSRKEEGDEVVVTIRNVKRCERCGDEKMVNQTKEVTSVRTPEEVGLDAAEGASATPEPAGEGKSPVTPVESEQTPAAEPTPDPDPPVDATVGDDTEPTVKTPNEFGGDGIDDSTAVNPVEDGADGQPESADHSGTGGEWDEDAVVEEPDAQIGGTAEEPGTQTGAAASEPSAAENPDEGWETGSDDWDDVEPDPDIDDAVILDAGETERDEVQWPEESDADPESATDTEGPDAPQKTDERTTNDAEIIDAGEAGADPAGGSAGGWPEHEDTGGAGGWPEHEGADEGYSATPNGDVDAEFAGDGLTPEVNGGAPDDSAAVDGITVGGGAAERTRAGGADSDAGTGTDTGSGEGFVRAGESTTEDVPADRVEFYCPNCGHARVAGASSIRAGDICPECKQGYIAERER